MIRRSIITYLLLSSVLLVWHPAHFLKDVLVAPLIFLVPLGLGLSMTRVCFGNLFEQAAPSKLSLLLLSLFLGLTGHTIVYQQLERYDLLQQLYPGLYPLALGGALVGFYREHTLLHTDSSDRTSFLGAAVLLPLMLLMYAFYYLKFTQYPLRDVFQETHFMKGAMELARFHILNPFTADSYIPLLQVHLGVLHDWYGYDLLSSQWILPVLCAIVRYASLHCFFSAVTDSKLTRIIAAGFAIITLQNLFSSTNGDMLFSVCLVLMAVLIRFERGWRSTGSAWLFLGALMIFSIVLYKVSTVQTIGNYWAVVGGGIAVYSRRIPGASAITAQGILLCATGVALHPAVALLYLFCSLGTVGIHRTILSGWVQWLESRRRGFLILLTALTALTGGFFAILLQRVFQREKSPPILHGVAEWILGKEITGAEGLRNTIIEWIRLAPPAFLLLFFLLAAFQGVAIWRRSRLDSEASLSQRTDTSWISSSLVFAWTGCLAGLVLSFSGWPYVHRALYFPLVLGCLLIAFLLHQEIARSVEERRRLVLLKYGIFLLGYLIVGGRYGYKVAELGAHSNVLYVQALSPYYGLTILGIVILLGTAALARTLWRPAVLILSTLFLAVASDKFAIKSYGYRYSYGDDGWVSGRPISHYSLQELELADRIRNLPLNTVLMSDPYTLSIVQAQTGLNGLYTFSNLGVMREEYRHSLRRILRSIRDRIAKNQVGGNDAILEGIMEFITQYPGALPETQYVFQKRIGRGLNRQEIKDSLVIILNAERTFQWMDGKEDYFPWTNDRSITMDVGKIAKSFELIQNVDDKVFALRLRI